MLSVKLSHSTVSLSLKLSLLHEALNGKGETAVKTAILSKCFGSIMCVSVKNKGNQNDPLAALDCRISSLTSTRKE